MDKDSSLASRPPCPSCGSKQILKNGSTHHKKQKFLCKECGRLSWSVGLAPFAFTSCFAHGGNPHDRTLSHRGTAQLQFIEKPYFVTLGKRKPLTQ